MYQCTALGADIIILISLNVKYIKLVSNLSTLGGWYKHKIMYPMAHPLPSSKELEFYDEICILEIVPTYLIP